MLYIPFKDTPSFFEQLTIEDEVYHFRFHWNWRGQYWVMDILDKDMVVIAAGTKIVKGIDLLQHIRHLAVPQGALYVIEEGDDYQRLEDGELGDVAQLVYLTEAERVAL